MSVCTKGSEEAEKWFGIAALITKWSSSLLAFQHPSSLFSEEGKKRLKEASAGTHISRHSGVCFVNFLTFPACRFF